MAPSVCDIIPAPSGLETYQTRCVIQQCIDHSSFDDALFLAELLHEKVNTDESLLILCDCLLRLCRIEEVYTILSPSPKTTPRLRYMFAKCCYDLEKFEESERVLLDEELDLHPVLCDSDSAPFARNLLATIMCETGRVSTAKYESTKAVEANPFMWSGITNFIRVGGTNVSRLFTSVERRFNENTESVPDRSKPHVPSASPSDDSSSLVTTKKTPQSSVPPPAVPLCAPRKSTRISECREARRSTRLCNQQDRENAGTRGTLRTVTQPRLGKAPSLRGRNSEIDSPVLKPITRSERSPSLRKTRDSGKQPLASRNANSMRSSLFSSTSASNSTNATGSPTKDQEKEESAEKAKAEIAVGEVLKDIFGSVKSLASIEEAVSNYKWPEALGLIQRIPWSLGRQSVALHLHARVMFEISEYAAARDILMEMRKLHPYRVEGTELLSTAMWHLQDHYGLSALTQELTTKARKRPQTWCVAGNCFSLQRQHPQAVECLERAVQLDPHFAYAFTLLGHELVYQEELEKAANAFRSALSISPNDYRAWYGLGQVHQRNEQMALAQSNMARALAINPTNRAMLCTLAQVEQSLNKPDRAMALYNKALELNPNDVACRYHRARLLFESKKYEECVKELEELKGLSPDEAYIFHLLGKVHRRLGNVHLALLNYSWASEMDPRGEQMMAHQGRSGPPGGAVGGDSSFDEEEDEEE